MNAVADPLDSPRQVRLNPQHKRAGRAGPPYGHATGALRRSSGPGAISSKHN